MTNILKMVPEFTTDDTVEVGTEETVESTVTPPGEEPGVEEKETPAAPPAESELEQKPADLEVKSKSGVDIGNVEIQVQTLREERIKLIKELQELRGQRRELKKEEIFKVDKKIDELKDIHPDDVNLIEKVLRSKGYLTREEAEGMSYKAIQNDELNKFLDEFSEYKVENDPQNINWDSLQRALAIYAKPQNPRGWGSLLKKAHRDIASIANDRTLEVKKQQIKTAGVGSLGVQRSSSRKTFDLEKRVMLKQGGFTDEDIARMESRL